MLMLCTKLRVATLTDRSFIAADRLIYRSSWIPHLIIHDCAASQLGTSNELSVRELREWYYKRVPASEDCFQIDLQKVVVCHSNVKCNVQRNN